MNNRILNNDDYSHSNILSLVQENKKVLKNVLLDLTDMLSEKSNELQELEKLVQEKNNEIKQLQCGLRVAAVYGRNFGHSDSILILHDKQLKIVKVNVNEDSVDFEQGYLDFE